MTQTAGITKRMLDRGGWPALFLLALLLPYELILFGSPLADVSSLELLQGAVLVLVGAHPVAQRRRASLPVPRSWLLLWGGVLVGLLLSTLLAPAFRANAAKASLRLLAGMALAAAVPIVVTSPYRRRQLVLALLLGGSSAALLGLVEAVRPGGLPLLRLFRPAPTTAGPFVRLTGPFSHANQTAMFLEATLPLLLVMVTQAAAKRRAWLVPGMALLVLYLQAIVLTYSRSGLAVVLLTSVGAAVFFLFRRRRSVALWWAGLAGALLLILLGNALTDPALRLRLGTEGDNEWYDLTFSVPEALTAVAGDVVTTTVTVRNDGQLTWNSSGPVGVQLAGRWYLAGEEEVLAAEPRWALPEPVPPGETAVIEAPLQVPRTPGVYRFQWDLVQENVIWFSYKNGVVSSTDLAVTPRPEGAPEPTLPADTEAALRTMVEAPPEATPIPGRRTLWATALQQLRDHPLFGIGLDNFRLTYGRALGYTSWNESIHANNTYIEMLVSLGLLGSVPFFAWLVVLVLSGVRTLSRNQPSLWAVAVAAGLVAYLLHGLLDFFLLFNDTALLFWLLVGLWLALRDHEENDESVTYRN